MFEITERKELPGKAGKGKYVTDQSKLLTRYKRAVNDWEAVELSGNISDSFTGRILTCGLFITPDDGPDGTDVYTSDPVLFFGHSPQGGGCLSMGYIDHCGVPMGKPGEDQERMFTVNFNHGIVSVSEEQTKHVIWLDNLVYCGSGLCYYTGDMEYHPAVTNSTVDLEGHAREMAKEAHKKQKEELEKQETQKQEKLKRDRIAEEEWQIKHAEYLQRQNNVLVEGKRRRTTDGSEQEEQEEQDLGQITMQGSEQEEQEEQDQHDPGQSDGSKQEEQEEQE